MAEAQPERGAPRRAVRARAVQRDGGDGALDPHQVCAAAVGTYVRADLPGDDLLDRRREHRAGQGVLAGRRLPAGRLGQGADQGGPDGAPERTPIAVGAEEHGGRFDDDAGQGAIVAQGLQGRRDHPRRSDEVERSRGNDPADGPRVLGGLRVHGQRHTRRADPDGEPAAHPNAPTSRRVRNASTQASPNM
ncbi:hypothetical protein SDC9_129305 [bioreactor metagenome]|uniref:Uncharacterized protein n=1 Tax=bioreactor metagenome TaxID=1076179 RepID=A0A645CZ48_9ZZZZ